MYRQQRGSKTSDDQGQAASQRASYVNTPGKSRFSVLRSQKPPTQRHFRFTYALASLSQSLVAPEH